VVHTTNQRDEASTAYSGGRRGDRAPCRAGTASPRRGADAAGLHAPAGHPRPPGRARRGRSAGVHRPRPAGSAAAKHWGSPSRSCRGKRQEMVDSACGPAGATRTRHHAGPCPPRWPTPRQGEESWHRASPPPAEGGAAHAEDAAVGQAPDTGQAVTAGRSPPRPLLPDPVGPEPQPPPARRGRATTANAATRPRLRELSRGVEAARRRDCWQALPTEAARGVEHVTAAASAATVPGHRAAWGPRWPTTRDRATVGRRGDMPPAHGPARP
jgi:hypothetical protein